MENKSQLNTYLCQLGAFNPDSSVDPDPKAVIDIMIYHCYNHFNYLYLYTHIIK